MNISLQLSMLLWISIWISLDFYGYRCIDLLSILDPVYRSLITSQKATTLTGRKPSEVSIPFLYSISHRSSSELPVPYNVNEVKNTKTTPNKKNVAVLRITFIAGFIVSVRVKIIYRTGTLV